VGGEPCPRDTALPLEAVALPAAVFHEGFLALLDGGRESPLRGEQAERRRRAEHTQHHAHPHRGCVHTSITAGSPAFTAATARLSAGPRSFGSLIGPADTHPMEDASLA